MKRRRFLSTVAAAPVIAAPGSSRKRRSSSQADAGQAAVVGHAGERLQQHGVQHRNRRDRRGHADGQAADDHAAYELP
jgi:hypothetical protein